jgi:hypothetical protein
MNILTKFLPVGCCERNSKNANDKQISEEKKIGGHLKRTIIKTSSLEFQFKSNLFNRSRMLKQYVIKNLK